MADAWRLWAGLDQGLHLMLKPPHWMKPPWPSPSDLDLAALAFELSAGLGRTGNFSSGSLVLLLEQKCLRRNHKMVPNVLYF